MCDHIGPSKPFNISHDTFVIIKSHRYQINLIHSFLRFCVRPDQCKNDSGIGTSFDKVLVYIFSNRWAIYIAIFRESAAENISAILLLLATLWRMRWFQKLVWTRLPRRQNIRSRLFLFSISYIHKEWRCFGTEEFYTDIMIAPRETSFFQVPLDLCIYLIRVLITIDSFSTLTNEISFMAFYSIQFCFFFRKDAFLQGKCVNIFCSRTWRASERGSFSLPKSNVDVLVFSSVPAPCFVF